MAKPKIELTEYLDRLLTAVCEVKQISRGFVNREFISIVEGLVKAGSLDFGLGFHYKQARENIKGNAENIGNFDVSLLETSTRVSGYNGVYKNGRQWRARVPDRKGHEQLPLRDTPVEAAIDRFKWYEEHALPYGNIGWHIDYWERTRPLGSMEEIFSYLLEDAKDGAVGGKRPFKLHELQKFIARWREKNPKQEPTFTGSSMPRSTAADVDAAQPPPAEVLCGICSKPIEDSYDMRIYKDVWRHRRCREPVTEN